jgi:hypothetical protein
MLYVTTGEAASSSSPASTVGRAWSPRLTDKRPGPDRDLILRVVA